MDLIYQVFAKLMDELNSPLGILVIVLILILVWKISKFTATWEIREKDLNRLKDKWEEDIPPMKAKMESVEKNLEKIESKWDDNISHIKTRIDHIYQKYQGKSSPVVSSSPLRLTDTGKEIAAAIDAENILKRNYDALAELIHEKKPEHAYDVQLQSVDVVERELPNMLNDEELKKAKDQALKYGIPLDSALAVVAVLLRDQILEKMGMPLGNVDKHDPQTT